MESLISSSHHYYVTFFTLEKNFSLDQVSLLFDKRYKPKKISNTICQTRISLNSALGSEKLLSNNRHTAADNNIKYHYDLYVGSISNKKNSFFVCYPYSSLSKQILDTLKSIGGKLYFYSGNVPKVIKYVKENAISVSESAQFGRYTLSIVKYSAEVVEESNAKIVSLAGVSPINSKIYDVLNSSPLIKLTPLSLKISCVNSVNPGESMELAFDKFGNYRFWLKRNAQSEVLPLLNHIFSFFTEQNAFDFATRLSSNTTI